MAGFIDSIIGASPLGAGALAVNKDGQPNGFNIGGGILQPTTSLRSQTRIPVGSYGDSIANINAFANFDLRTVNAAIQGCHAERFGPWVNGFSNGLIRIVANCGISGEDTTAMLARESAGAGATRKNIADLVSTGAKYAITSIGINNFQNQVSNVSNTTAELDAIVLSTYNATITLLQIMRVNGVWPVSPSLLGYSSTSYSAVKNTNIRYCIAAFNRKLGAAINGANGALGSYVDVNSIVADSTGVYRDGMSEGDGVHPSYNGAAAYAKEVTKEILRVEGVHGLSRQAWADYPNTIVNPAFNASSAGLVTGAALYATSGTITIVQSVIDVGGKKVQEAVCTPTALTSGYAGLAFEFNIPTNYATDAVLAGEIDLYIDNGSFAPATNVFQFATRLRQNSTIIDCPVFNTGVATKVGLNQVINLHMALNQMVVPAGVKTSSYIACYVFVNSFDTFRVRISSPRVVIVG